MVIFGCEPNRLGLWGEQTVQEKSFLMIRGVEWTKHRKIRKVKPIRGHRLQATGHFIFQNGKNASKKPKNLSNPHPLGFMIIKKPQQFRKQIK